MSVMDHMRPESMAVAKAAKPSTFDKPVEGFDSKHYAARLLKAIHGHDADGVDDALRGHYAACESEEPEGT